VIRLLNGEPFPSPEMETVEQKNEDGTPKVDDRGKPIMISRQKLTTVRDIIVMALSNPEPGQELKEMMNRGILARRVADADGPYEFRADDVTLVKNLLPKAIVNPIVVMQVVALLDPAEMPEDMREKPDELTQSATEPQA
jgi:hypothetical protein